MILTNFEQYSLAAIKMHRGKKNKKGSLEMETRNEKESIMEMKRGY